jgi:hypothetical protein
MSTAGRKVLALAFKYRARSYHFLRGDLWREPLGDLANRPIKGAKVGSGERVHRPLVQPSHHHRQLDRGGSGLRCT